MQIDVHSVDAQVAGPHLADDGVEVGAVAVEVAAGLVQGVRDLDDVPLEQAAGIGVGQHDRGDVRPQTILEGRKIHAAVIRGLDGVDREA